MTRVIKQPQFKFNVGDRARDRMTTYEGIIIARTDWLNQCNTYNIKAQKLNADGKPIESIGVEEPNVELIEEDAFDTKAEKQEAGAKKEKTGGDPPPIAERSGLGLSGR